MLMCCVCCHHAASGVVTAAALPDALEQLARRILPSTDGKFEPSPPPQLLDVLTDYDLLVAMDAVWRVAAEQQPPPSGNARYRLLAWVVADARGAAVSLLPATALKIGKRLEAQALKVRGDFGEQRSAARHAAAADASLAPGLAAQLEAIDAAECAAMEAARKEIYVGFVELQPPPPPPPLPPPEPALSRTEQAQLALQQREEEEEAEHRRLVLDSLPDMPADLSAQLGPDGVQALWHYQMDELHFIDDAAQWCSVVLPQFAAKLLADAVQHTEEQARMESRHREELEREQSTKVIVASNLTSEQERERRMAVAIKYDEEIEEMDLEIIELKKQLAVAEGKVEMLQGLLSQQLGAHNEGV